MSNGQSIECGGCSLRDTVKAALVAAETKQDSGAFLNVQSPNPNEQEVLREGDMVDPVIRDKAYGRGILRVK